MSWEPPTNTAHRLSFGLRLSDLDRGRDNNLNLVRAIAAAGVLVSHAWPISLGRGAIEPLKDLTGFTLGTLCVFVFFSISGYLITASWRRNPDVARFLHARALRLFPGLFVSLLLVAFVLGPVTTTQPVRDYLGAPETWTFLLRNTALISPQFTLPGVFEANPYPTVEGSIWTLIHEVACYLGVLLAGIAGLVSPSRLGWFLLSATMLWLCLALFFPPPGLLGLTHGLALPFLAGAAMYAVRDTVRLHGGLAIALIVVALLVCHVDPQGKGGVASQLAVTAALTYATFWFGYGRFPGVHRYNALGDYSYGIYIYAFPMQGAAVWALGSQTPAFNVLVSFPVTLLFAIVSWHLIEDPALKTLSARSRSAA